MLELETDAGDDPDFIDVASRLITGAAIVSGFRVIVAVHIDHWFGDRWLGFCGKLLGQAGVRNRRLTDELTPPPFHPHRVRSVRAYDLGASGRFEFWEDIHWLHDFRSSEANLGHTLQWERLYAWYTGDTEAADKAAVMAYLVGRNSNAAWYVGFDKAPKWHVAKTVAIAPHKVQEMLERVVPGEEHADPFAPPDPPSR